MSEPRKIVINAPVRIAPAELRRIVRWQASSGSTWVRPTLKVTIARTTKPTETSLDKDAHNAVVISAALMDAGLSVGMLAPEIVNEKVKSAESAGIRIVVEEAA